MKKTSILVAACLCILPAIGAEPAQTFADIREVIRQELREGELEVDTPAGRYIHPPCNHDMKVDDPRDPVLGPSIEKMNDGSRTTIRAWAEKKPKWVAIIAPADAPARDFVDLCSLLRELGVGYTTFPSEDVEGRKFNRLTLISGNFTQLSFPKTKLRLPLHRPIAPRLQQAPRNHPYQQPGFDDLPY